MLVILISMLIDIFSSVIIEDVSQYCRSGTLLAIAYFYFDFSDPQKRRNENLIRSLITQFSTQCINALEALALLYAQNRDGKQQATSSDLMAALKYILGEFQHSYIIIDALDECTDRMELLSFISEIVNWKLGTLHILTVSRTEKDIEDCLTCHVSDDITIQSELIYADIQLHVRERLHSDARFRWPVDVLTEIEEALMNGANGM
jgi:hypothetical protein